MIEELVEKVRLMTRVRATTFLNEIRLILSVLKYSVDRVNSDLSITVDIDGVRYRLVDFESLSIVSPRGESYMWDYLRPAPKEVFIDIGAHIGKYALRIAKHYDAIVVALEPDPENFHALQWGVVVNGLSNVTALNIAAYDHECTLFLHPAPYSRGKPQKGRSSVIGPHANKSVPVWGRPLDSIVNELALNRVDWIKIDAEGAEYEILRGSERTIKSYRPYVVAECTRNQELLFDFMRGCGYQWTLVGASNYFFEYIM